MNLPIDNIEALEGMGFNVVTVADYFLPDGAGDLHKWPHGWTRTDNPMIYKYRDNEKAVEIDFRLKSVFTVLLNG